MRATETKVSPQTGKLHRGVYLQALLGSFIRSLLFLYEAVPTAQVLCSDDNCERREKHKEGKRRRTCEGQSLALFVKGRRKPHQN